MAELIKRLMEEEDGATSSEYSLIAVFIAIVIVGAVTLLGTNLTALYNAVAAAI